MISSTPVHTYEYDHSIFTMPMNVPSHPPITKVNVIRELSNQPENFKLLIDAVVKQEKLHPKNIKLNEVTARRHSLFED